MEGEESEKVGLGRCMLLHWQGPLLILLTIFGAVALVLNNEVPYRVLYMIIIMMVCWVTEVFPRAITSMMPFVGLPFLRIIDSNEACKSYFKDTTVMFIVSLIIACGLEFTKLHTRFALFFIRIAGTGPRGLHIYLVMEATVLSFLVPNGVAIAFMAPITKAVLDELAALGLCKIYEDDSPDIPKLKKKPSRVALCMYLSVAYACSISGSGCLTGSPANLVVKGIYEKRFPGAPDEINFKNYLLYALPPMLVYLILMVFIMQLTYMGLFRKNSNDAMEVNQTEEVKMASKAAAIEKYESLGSMNLAQCSLMTLFVGLIALLVTRRPEFIEGWADHFDNDLAYSSVTTIIVVLIFALPAQYLFLKCWDASSVGKTPGLLNWKHCNASVSWDMIFVVGCGGAIGDGTRWSGLANKLGDFLSTFDSLPGPVSLLLLLTLTILFTNITINAAVMNAIAPGILQMAIKCKVHPLFFMMATCLAGSMAFLMPQATSPNALVAVYGNIRPKQMIVAGLGPTLAALITIYIFAQTWGPVVYSDLTEFPTWVNELATDPDYGTKLVKDTN